MDKLYTIQARDSIIEPPAKIKITEYLSYTCKSFGLQGVPHIAKNSSILKRVFWTICIIFSGCFLALELTLFFEKFLEFKASTSVTLETAENLDFPAVTVCNVSPVIASFCEENVEGCENGFTIKGATSSGGQSSNQKGPTASNPDNSMPSSQGTSNLVSPTPTGASPPGTGGTVPTPAGPTATPQSSITVEPTPGMSMGTAGPKPPPPLSRKRRSTNDDNEFSIKVVQAAAVNMTYRKRAQTGHQLVDVILECTYEAKTCDVSKAFKTWHWSPIYGNCWTYNFGYLKSDSPLKDDPSLYRVKKGTEESGKNSGIENVRGVGPRHGLNLVLYSDETQFISSIRQSGWRILIHNQTEMPFPDEEGVFVRPGTFASISFKLNYYSRLGSVSNYFYTAKYSDCITDRERFHSDWLTQYSDEFEVGYSRKACLRMCYQKRVIQKCNCYDWEFPRPRDFNTPCLIQDSNQWRCKRQTWENYIKSDYNCKCPDTCESYRYTTSLSTLKWPTHDIKTVVNEPNLCSDLHEKLYSIVTTASPEYSKSNLRQTKSEDPKTQNYGNIAFLMKHLEGCSNDNDIAKMTDMITDAISPNFAEVQIHMETFEYQAFIESELFEWPDLVAYIGGIFSLFFGFTMFTCFELIVFIADLVVIGVAKLSSNNSVGDTANDNSSPKFRRRMSQRNVMSASAVMDMKKSEETPLPDVTRLGPNSAYYNLRGVSGRFAYK